MAENIIYISNEPIEENIALEKTMVDLADQLNVQILVQDFQADAVESADAPIIILCNGVNVQDEAVLKNIEQIYYANHHIILYKPTNTEINTIYNRLEGREYFKADNKVAGYSLFGLKMSEDGICYVLEDHEKDPELISQNMLNFLSDKQELSAPALRNLRSQAVVALSSDTSDINLASMARQHVVTQNFSLQGKPCALSYYMVSCHKYDGSSPTGGEDWFFIQQYGILNGAPGYSKYWAGSRVDVNDESWYVGQGEVCLNYVDYYKMKNYIPIPQTENQLLAHLVFAEPQAINSATSYTVSESIELGGTIGFEGGGSTQGPEAKGSASFSASAGFSSSYSFEVLDCTCKGTSLGENTASAEWEYRFKRASQNRSAGKWQRLHDPAALSCSVFSPLNSWVWKFDSNKRNVYKSFTSEMEIGIMNTISRYSGSQSPKNIAGKCKDNEESSVSFNITFSMPPLLAVDLKSLVFDKDGGMQKLHIASQGTWKIQIKDNPSWIRVDPASGSGEVSEVFVFADAYTENKERKAILQIYRIKDPANGTTDELVEVKVVQSSGKVN